MRTTALNQKIRSRHAANARARQVAESGSWQQNVDALIADPFNAVGQASQRGANRAAAYLRSQQMPQLARNVRGLGALSAFALPVAGAAAAYALPAVGAAMAGSEQAGTGGAMIQGGGALTGALMAGAINPLLAPVGGLIGGAIGGGATGLAQAAVADYHSGGSGPLAGVGQLLDPLITSEAEKAEKDFVAAQNTPAMRAIRAEQQKREAQARADQAYMLHMQALMS